MLLEKGMESIRPDMQWLGLQRFPIWEASGANRKILIDTLSRTRGLFGDTDRKGGWTYEFMHVGDKCMDKAWSQAKSDREKESLYNSTAAYYNVARFPIMDTPLKKEVYSRQKLAIKESAEHAGINFWPVDIPFENTTIKGYYYSPRLENEIIRPESILLTGGAELYKEDLRYIPYKIVSAGVTCLAIDMPGTGDSELKLGRDTEYAYAEAVKYLASRGDIDPNRIGIMGIGFGGYWALRTAAKCPEIKACVNCGSPVQVTFTRENLGNLPEYLKMVLAFIQGNDPYDNNAVERSLDSLTDYSILKQTDLRSVNGPVLSINGSDDPYVPIDDLFFIHEKGGIGQDEWVYREDGHCAPRSFTEWVPRAVDWLANKLGGPERIRRPDLAKL